MISTLELSLEAAFAKSRTESPVEKAANPFDALSNSQTFGVNSFDTGQDENEKFAHYRESFSSAANPIVKRISSQPIMMGRLGVTDQSRSLSTLVQKGVMSQSPSWVGNPEDIEILTVHPFMTAWNNPNRLLTTFNMMEMLVASLIVVGKAFIVAIEAEDRPYDLYSIPATWMKPVHDGNSLYDSWIIKPPSSNGDGIQVSDENVSQFYFADPANPSGCISPMSLLAKSILTDESITTAQYEEFRQGGMPKVALIAGDVMNETSFTDTTNGVSSARPIRLEPEQRRQITTWFKQEFAGAKKHGLPIVLDAVIRDIKTLSRTPAEMAFLESAGITKEKIYEGLGTPKVLNGQFETITRAAGGLAEQFFAVNVLNPIITMMSQSLTKKMGPLFAVDGEELAIWIAPAVANDPEITLEWARLGIRGYAITRNEFRKMSPFPLAQREGMDDVMTPQTMEERETDEDTLGVGRISTLSE